jgi:hypothetical protein
VKRRAIAIAAIVLAALCALAIRVVVEGRRELARGDALAIAGEPRSAAIAYEAAARWYLPLAPHVDVAYAKLRELTRGDPPLALAAWRAIRGAARATRSHAHDLADADAAIATLEAADPDRGSGGDAPTYQTALARDDRAGLAGAWIAALGLVLWLGGAAVLVARGIAADGKVNRRPALRAGIAIVVGLGVWLLGLYNA